MKQSNVIIFLYLSALVLLCATSLAGIVLDDGGRPYVFTSARGERVDLYGGQGLYQHDNVYKAFGFRSFDWVSLVVVSPLLVLGLALYRRGQMDGHLAQPERRVGPKRIPCAERTGVVKIMRWQ